MQSRVTTRAMFKSCRRYFKYNGLESLIPIQTSMDARWFGTGIHYALAQYYMKKAPLIQTFLDWLQVEIPFETQTSMWPEERKKFSDMKTLAVDMLTRYQEIYQVRDMEWEVLYVEHPLKIKIPHSQDFLTGTMDMIVRYRGKLWVVDHKTYTSFSTIQDLELDDQMTAYLWLVWKSFGEFPGGAIYNMLRKATPAEPMILKSGGLSKAKSIDTTYEIYLKTIVERNLNLNDYQDILETLKRNEFFKRELVVRSKAELENFSTQLKYELTDMRWAIQYNHFYPSISRECKFCDFFILCKCENEGGDIESVKKYNFKKEERR